MGELDYRIDTLNLKRYLIDEFLHNHIDTNEIDKLYCAYIFNDSLLDKQKEELSINTTSYKTFWGLQNYTKYNIENNYYNINFN